MRNKRTIVFLHAHPDDEALLTGGTMTRLAADGHRVVLVTATTGERGLASNEMIKREPLGSVRARELAASAHALGCERLVVLGFADSGSAMEPAAGSFATISVDVAARIVADVLLEERADVLTIYDAAGGYGHPDHRQVHQVGVRAAELAGTPIVLEATVDRRLLVRALRLANLFRPKSPAFDPNRFGTLFTSPDHITHCINVRAFLRQKRAAMAAHASQTTADRGDRSMAWFLRLPTPIFGLIFGREWFVERGRPPSSQRLDDALATFVGPVVEVAAGDGDRCD
jgi:LmbE family N-acetylglucosaminyl deacetylase